MKASLRIEAIGDDTDQLMRGLVNLTNGLMPGLGDITFYGPSTKDRPKSSHWVAEIVGLDPVFRYKHVFLRGKKDYTFSNSVGSRGVYIYYLLESGKLYEVKQPVSWKRTDRYFCIVNDDGDIIRVNEEYMAKWKDEHWELPY